MSSSYVELHCLSNFTFLRGASHPEELVEQALALGYSGLTITDECSLAGVVRAHLAVRGERLKVKGEREEEERTPNPELRTPKPQTVEHRPKNFTLIVGTELRLDDGCRFVLLATDRKSYGLLAHLITQARRAAEKGSYRLTREMVERHYPAGCLALWLPGAKPDSDEGTWLKVLFPGATWIAVELHLNGRDRERTEELTALGAALGLPLVASGDVHMHDHGRQRLQDTLTAIRLGLPLAKCGFNLYPNGERHLRSLYRLSKLYPPALLEETLRIAERCHFSLEELRYEYPKELVPEGHTAASWLRALTEEGMRGRWPEGVPEKVRGLVEHELALIAELAYEPYFLTVHDIVRFARGRGILCQGRGSAANSAVCFALSITEVDPARMNMLFERFISRERDEPPDIDVDFEHERREEVIQYIYSKYGRERAALAATVITYRPRSAIRDVGKALGLPPEALGRLAESVQWWDHEELKEEQLKAAGFEPGDFKVKLLIDLVGELLGFPRHLSQHVGGFVISEGLLSQLVPIENTAMPDRTVIQWEKDDLEALGLLKIDVLALGMLTAIRKALTSLSAQGERPFAMSAVPAEDPAVYAMLRQGDSVGVFQVESRAQMAMLPRLKPACFYDLVIEIAIVRPGPIQGEMVHPYLARRAGREPVSYPGPEVKKVLERTLGVPIFQEQVMQLAVVAAGFTPGEADQLRRSMATFRRRGGMEKFEKRLIEGMRKRGYNYEFARQICQQIKGFGEYGFPESHSASFALLAYVSAWLKRHHPAAFACALLNSQPMGFYAPSQLVQDARRHGVEVRGVDVRMSEWDCTLEPAQSTTRPPLRLGMRLVNGVSRAGMDRLLTARKEKTFADIADLKHRARLARDDLDCLAGAGALAALGGNRHQAFWTAAGVESPVPLAENFSPPEAIPLLRPPTEGENLCADYASTGLTLGRHPLALLRGRLAEEGVHRAADFQQLHNGARARAAGLVICRQHPSSANGVIFLTLEDETGVVNVIVWESVARAQRQALLGSTLLEVTGSVQHEEGVLHLVAGRLKDRSGLLGALKTPSRDFR